MIETESTRDKLLFAGKRLFWTRGFSNVTVRDIARESSADIALISRYFGSKRGLFDATMDLLPALDAADFDGPEHLIDCLVKMFIEKPRLPNEPSEINMIIANAGDFEVGAVVHDLYRQKWQAPIEQIMGDPGRAAVLSAALFGLMVAEKAMQLKGIAPHHTPKYEAQLRALFGASLNVPMGCRC
ncbi:MAG: TetR family transcriptional regulator [Pseudomonadota bacterium]